MATKIPSPPAHHAEQSHTLFSLPPELTIKIFVNLSSSFNVFALAATCRWLRHVWTTSVIPIYNSMAPRSIPCERDVRRFLVDQHEPRLESSMNAENVVQMMKNAGIVNQATVELERGMVCRVRTRNKTPGRFGAEEAVQHDRTLTDTECTRFARTYFLLWALMRLDPAAWPARLESMTSQQLYYLIELTKFPQGIGHEEDDLPDSYPIQVWDSFFSFDSGLSVKRIVLQKKIQERIQYVSQRLSQRFFQQDAVDASVGVSDQFFVVSWDDWQPTLKERVCHVSDSTIRLNPEGTRRYLWVDNLAQEV